MSIYDVKPAGVNPGGEVLAKHGNKRPTRLGGQKPPPQMIQLLYKIVGRGTRLMAELKPGDQVGMIAPLGHGFFVEEYWTPQGEQTKSCTWQAASASRHCFFPQRIWLEAGFDRGFSSGAGQKRIWWASTNSSL